MTDRITLPDPDPAWGPATTIMARGTNPAQQYSAFQFAGGALKMHRLALLAVPLDDIARRLLLHLEDSWDDYSNVRTAMFELGKADYALSADGDPPGTFVWISRTDPETAAERLTRLLDALGVGMEAVSATCFDGETWSYVESGDDG